MLWTSLKVAVLDLSAPIYGKCCFKASYKPRQAANYDGDDGSIECQW